MKVLVTGGTGFIGSQIVDRLLLAGHEVRCLVRTPDKAKSLINLGLEVVCGDLVNQDSLRKSCDGVECIFHAAAKVSDWGHWRDFEENTVVGTVNILNAAITASVPRFLHISTVDVYRPDMMGRGLPVREDAPLISKKCGYYYARAKLLAEQRVRDCQELDKINTTIVRPATVYGPGDWTILPRLIDFLKDPNSGWVKGRNPVFGLVYVTDVADLCIIAATSEKGIGQVYNASSNQNISVKHYAEVICKELGIPIPHRSYPYWFVWTVAVMTELYWTLSQRSDPPSLTRAGLRLLTLDQRFDIRKAQEELGWAPHIRFHEGIARTIVWAKQNLAICSL